MTACRSLLSLVFALVPLAAFAAPRTETGATLDLAVRCDACTEAAAPSIGMLWRAENGQEPPLASLEASDWSAGTFLLHAPGAGRIALQGEPLPEGTGWTIRVPVGPMGRPFRVVTALPGFAADRAAWWPEREEGPYAVTLQPVADVLEENPAWDPQRTGECDVLVPASVPSPITLFVQGQPRAWLYPAEDAADGTPQWTFQFVRPGEGLLERVSVLVPAFREGESWSFRLPLQGVLAGGATWPSGSGGMTAPEPADEIRIGGAGTIRLQDCPRASR